jgi:hypothetical protein
MFRGNLVRYSLYVFTIFFGVLSITSAHAQSLALSVKVPGNIPDSSGMRNILTKQLRANLLGQGFVVRGSVSEGYRLVISADVEESGGTSDPPSCIIALRLQIIMLPQNREVLTASANGRANFTQAIALDKTKRNQLRNQATTYAARELIKPLRSMFQQIEEKLKSLPKGTVLGKKIGGRVRGGGGGGGIGRPADAKPGKPLPGRPPQQRLLPAEIAWDGQKPPAAYLSAPPQK